MAIFTLGKGIGPRQSGTQFVHARSDAKVSGSQGSLFEATQRTGQARWSKKDGLSMNSRSEGDLHDDLRAPSKDIHRRPEHPRIKDGRVSGLKRSVQTRQGPAHAVGRTRQGEEAGYGQQHSWLGRA